MSIEISENGSSIATLKGVRGSFLKLTKAEAVKAEPDGKKRFSVVVLVPKSNKALKEILDKGIEAVKKANPKVKWFASNIMLKDGDTDEKTLPEYAGHWFFTASRNEDQKRPDCYGKKVSAGKLSAEEVNDLFYAGCLMNLKVGIYKPKGWDKVCASLEVAQFAGDGERLSGGNRASTEGLEDIEEEEEGEALPEGI